MWALCSLPGALHHSFTSQVNISVSHSVVSDSLKPLGLWPARLLCAWSSLGRNAGVGGHSLLQGIFPTQELNPGLLHFRQILHHLSHQGSVSKDCVPASCPTLA